MTTLRFLRSSHNAAGRLLGKTPGRHRRRILSLRETRIETLERLIMPSSFVVSSTADSGTNTLRWAISSSNAATGGTNQITFKIGTGLQTISPTSPLPTITNPVVIDGTSQGGTGYVGAPLIVLRNYLNTVMRP
jgi:hypothetical protein